MYFLNINKKKGFVTLFFIFSISVSVLTLISLSTEKAFNFISIKQDFYKNRRYLHDKVLCSDVFINILIESDYNLDFIDHKYDFKRNISLTDEYMCHIENINIKYLDGLVYNIFFICDGFGFEYIYENGFIKYIKSFNLF